MSLRACPTKGGGGCEYEERNLVRKSGCVGYEAAYLRKGSKVELSLLSQRYSPASLIEYAKCDVCNEVG